MHNERTIVLFNDLAYTRKRNMKKMQSKQFLSEEITQPLQNKLNAFLIG